MEKRDLVKILEQVKSGDLKIDDAVLKFQEEPFTDIEFAKIDNHRGIRNGNSEVIYGAGKTADEIIAIVKAMEGNGDKCILITRLDKEKAEAVARECEISYNERGRIAVHGQIPEADGNGRVLIMCAGTSDIPVCEEARVTLEVLGNRTESLYDVGVAGLERLLSRLDTIMKADIIIAIAGMEGALPTIVNSLVDCPVIAVPTSVGYGTSLEGFSALLTMLNSCSSGMAVQNIDNGFGAACFASRINHLKVQEELE